MWVAVFGTTARVSPTCPRMCVSQLVLDGGGGGGAGEKAIHTVSCSPTKHFLSEGALASLPTLCCYLFIFLWPPPPPFLSCWVRIPGSLSLLGILEILGEEGREGWDVLEAGGREGGGH